MEQSRKYQGHFADCYVLTDKRTKDWITKFLDSFLPNRKQTVEEFEIPQHSDSPTITFKTDDELIDYLVNNKQTKHTLYWANEDKSDLRGAMIFFTGDGFMVPGVYCETFGDDTSIEDKFLNKLKAFWETDKGYIAYEQPAPQDKDEFLKIIGNLSIN